MIRESLEAEFLFNERLKKHYKVLLAIEILWLFPVSMNPDPEGGGAGFTVGGSSTVAATTSGGSIWGSTGGGSISGTASGTVSGTTNASGVSGALRNGSVSGSIGAGGGTPTDYTGGAETAPDHIYVRCLIRAKP